MLCNQILFSKINIIPHSLEKFLAVTMDNFIFLDSYAFLPSSLDALSSNLLPEEKNDILLQFFNADDLDLVSNKGFLPHDYIDDWCRYEEKALPSIENFYNQLNDCKMSEQDYEKVQIFGTISNAKHWVIFKMSI